MIMHQEHLHQHIVKMLSHIAHQWHTTLLVPENDKGCSIESQLSLYPDIQYKQFLTDLLKSICHGRCVKLRFYSRDNRQCRINHRWPGFDSWQELLMKRWVCSDSYKSNLVHQKQDSMISQLVINRTAKKNLAIDRNIFPHKPRKQYHVILGFPWVYMALVPEAGADEQSGKPICEVQSTLRFQKIIWQTCQLFLKTGNTEWIYYLSQAEADPRNNLGHKDAASAYFLSTIKWSRYLEPT